MAKPIPVLQATDQSNKLQEVTIYGATTEQVATGWRFVISEKKIMLSMGEVAAMRNYMEGLAKQVFPNSATHYVVKGGVASLEHVLGIGATTNDAISATN